MRAMYLSVILGLVFVVGHEGLHVHGPSGPVEVQLGGSIILSCFIEGSLPLEDLHVEWRKMASDSVVSFFQQGESRADLQSQAFRGRADFFPDEVSKGNFSILLRNVVEEDAGGYKCKVKTARDSNEVIIEVKHIRSFVVTGADRDVFASKGEDVVLNCSVDSHVPTSEIEEVTWKRKDGDQDILVLLYQDREIFSDSSHEHYQGRVDFFSSEIPKGNFSLKLTDVQMEDKGEFRCDVYTRTMSGRATVVLQGVGFSALHIVMLVLCLLTLFLTLGFCVPVFILLRKKEPDWNDWLIIHLNLILQNKAGMKRQLLLMLCPNICLFVTFCLWSTEGLVSAVICSIVSIMRPVLLLKTSPHLSKLADQVEKMVKALAFPIYHVTIATAACSVFVKDFRIGQNQTEFDYILILAVILAAVILICAVAFAVSGLQILLTMCLEVVNLLLLGIFRRNHNSNFDYILKIYAIITPLLMGMLVALILQRHFFQGKPLKCWPIALLSVIVTICSLSLISIYLIFSSAIKDFAKGWILVFEGVLYLLVWLGVIYLLRCHQKQRCCFKWRTVGYLCCGIIVTCLIATFIAVSFHYLSNIEDSAGYLSLISLAHVLAALCLFKHPKHLPGFLHTVIYMFGAVGLCTVNALVLATELILKAGKGARTIGDLRVIVLPLEIVYLFAWLALQIYDSWMRFRQRAEPEDERRTRPEIVLELEVLSDRNPD